jgi:hypothetical protein
VVDVQALPTFLAVAQVVVREVAVVEPVGLVVHQLQIKVLQVVQQGTSVVQILLQPEVVAEREALGEMVLSLAAF